MAKRPARRGGKKAKSSRTPTGARKTKGRNARARKTNKTRTNRKTTPKNVKAAGSRRPASPDQGQTIAKAPRLYRDRRTLDEPLPGPPSSLDLDRHASAARSGRAELAAARQHHATMTPAITGGDVDADLEAAYFSGDGAPGGDNPTPDQDVVDEIGKALGVEYQDNEELKPGDKIGERDKHRWELDPASSEDYTGRK
jgi:uncharacterized protein DUF6335